MGEGRSVIFCKTYKSSEKSPVWRPLVGALPHIQGDLTTKCLLTPPWGQGLDRHS